jgi:hypothetical protein
MAYLTRKSSRRLGIILHHPRHHPALNSACAQFPIIELGPHNGMRSLTVPLNKLRASPIPFQNPSTWYNHHTPSHLLSRTCQRRDLIHKDDVLVTETATGFSLCYRHGQGRSDSVELIQVSRQKVMMRLEASLNIPKQVIFAMCVIRPVWEQDGRSGFVDIRGEKGT